MQFGSHQISDIESNQIDRILFYDGILAFLNGQGGPARLDQQMNKRRDILLHKLDEERVHFGRQNPSIRVPFDEP
jgi:hypothetical protein